MQIITRNRPEKRRNISVRSTVAEIMGAIAAQFGFIHNQKPSPAQLLEAIAYGHLDITIARANTDERLPAYSYALIPIDAKPILHVLLSTDDGPKWHPVIEFNTIQDAEELLTITPD